MAGVVETFVAVGGSAKSVCIDDDADFLLILGQFLRKLGVEFVGVSNAVLGVRAVQRERPDLVITDYRMPNAHGTYVLRCLLQDAALTGTPVIIVTGVDIRSRLHPARQTTVEQQLRELGAHCILRKPLNPHALAAAVTKCLQYRIGAPVSRERAAASAMPTTAIEVN